MNESAFRGKNFFVLTSTGRALNKIDDEGSVKALVDCVPVHSDGDDELELLGTVIDGAEAREAIIGLVGALVDDDFFEKLITSFILKL